jgi:hypothetical protein
MIEATFEVRRECILAGMASGPVTAIVPDRHRFDERDVEIEGLRDRPRHLCDFEGVGQSGALMVLGKDEYLGLAGQTSKRGIVKDAIAVPFKTGPVGIRLLVTLAIARSVGFGRMLGERHCFDFFSRLAGEKVG